VSAEHIALSVIVCTRDRCSALVELLEALTRLDTPGELLWEPVVVGNGSTLAEHDRSGVRA